MSINNLEVSTDPTLLSVDLPSSINTSPSASTFLPGEASSTCLLLPNSPSPELTHPLTPSTAADGSEPADNGIDGETNSSGSSSGLNMVIPQNDGKHLGNGRARSRKKSSRSSSEGKRTIKVDDITITCTGEIPAFVYWNWPFIRKCTFSIFICINIGVFAFVIGMIAKLPKKCNPIVPWYQGGVFYEIFPASFQDSNHDGIGDLRGITNRVNYFKHLGVTAVRLNSIFPAPHYPEHFDNRTTFFSIDPVLGDFHDFEALVANLHRNNISLLLDLPLLPLVDQLGEDVTGNSTSEEDNSKVRDAIRFWVERGVDGFYVKDLEHFHDDPSLVQGVREWREALGRGRCLIVSSDLIRRSSRAQAAALLPLVSLVDVRLNARSGAREVVRSVEQAIADLDAWIHWSIDGVSEKDRFVATTNGSIAPLLLELSLPGTPNIFYGNEVALGEAGDSKTEHNDTKHLHHLPMMEFKVTRSTDHTIVPWIPVAKSHNFQYLSVVRDLIELRKDSPAFYMNMVTKGDRTYPNTNLRSSQGDLVVVERHFPRRRNFGAFANLGNETLKIDLSSTFYSGDVVISTDCRNATKFAKIYFSDFELSSSEAIIVNLDK